MDAIVLAGGRGRRMGGADKAAVVVAGRTLLERSLDAVASADRTIVVGPERATSRAVSWTRESPPGGGPVAGIGAGLSLVRAETVAVIAVDLPFLGRADVDELSIRAAGLDGAICVDEGGRDQPLAGVYRTAALRAAIAGLEPTGASVTSMIEALRLARVVAPAAARDCDTESDVERWDRELGGDANCSSNGLPTSATH